MQEPSSTFVWVQDFDPGLLSVDQPMETITENRNQSECRAMEPHPNEDIYNITPTPKPQRTLQKIVGKPRPGEESPQFSEWGWEDSTLPIVSQAVIHVLWMAPGGFR
ncbi:hypothetical protein STEG23_034584 [Scotinomys teguina]